MGDENGDNMVVMSGYGKPGVQHMRLGLEDLVSVFVPAGLGVIPAELAIVKGPAHKIPLNFHFSR